MIKANELRIGNLVSVRSPVGIDIVFTIEEITRETILTTNGLICPIEELNGIAIHKSMLAVHGFKENREGGNRFYNGTEYNIIIWSHTGLIEFYREEDMLAEIQYWHQLQNLFFALTGKELTIKEQVPTP